MLDVKNAITPLNEGVFTGLSIEEVEARLEMTVLEVVTGLLAQCSGCHQCSNQTDCGTCNTCAGYSPEIEG